MQQADILKYKAVFFDLDGTMIDSAKDLSFAVSQMSNELNISKPSLEKVKTWIGNGTLKLVERSLTDSTGEKPDEEFLQKAFQIFSKAYRDCVGEHSVPFTGIKDLLVVLLSHNIKIACITNKPLEFTEFLLQQNMISQFFTVVCAGDNVKHRKPDPWPLLFAAEKCGVDIKECLMIGDSEHDINAARNAGCNVYSVTHGYNHGNNIALSNPDGVINSFTQLL